MANLQFTQVTVRVPTFLLFAAGFALVALLAFAGWRLGSPAPSARQEAETVNPLGGMDNVGKILPCGHPSISAMLGGDGGDVYACGHGHRFRSFGSWFMPL